MISKNSYLIAACVLYLSILVDIISRIHVQSLKILEILMGSGHLWCICRFLVLGNQFLVLWNFQQRINNVHTFLLYLLLLIPCCWASQQAPLQFQFLAELEAIREPNKRAASITIGHSMIELFCIPISSNSQPDRK